MLAVGGNEVYSVMVQIQHEKEVQLRQDGDRDGRAQPHSMFAVLGGVTQSFMISAFFREERQHPASDANLPFRTRTSYRCHA